MTMPSPDDRRYLKSHEWHMAEGDLITIGLSQFAVSELTDITYLEITAEPGAIAAGDCFGEIESVKTTSELYCGVSGEVVAVNEQVIEHPELINADAYGRGWMIKVRPSDAGMLDALLAAQEYDRLHD
jgi:glycine cleavage system H protein